MNMRAKYILLFIILACFSNCASEYKMISFDGATNIDVSSALSNKELTIDNLVNDIETIIPLQTNQESMVSNIMDYFVTNEYIYINDLYQRGSVIIFDIKGNFVRRLKSGNGPGEINHVHKIFYDYENDNLYTMDFARFNKYSKDGSFIDSYPMFDFTTDDIAKVQGGFLTARRRFDNKAFDIKRFDDNFKELSEVYMPKLTQELPRKITRGFNGMYWIIRTLDNNLYIYNGDSVRTIYHLNFPEYEYNAKTEYYGPQYAQYYFELIKNIDNGKYIFDCSIFCESKDYIMFRLMSSDGFKNILFNKRTNNSLSIEHQEGSLFSLVNNQKSYYKGNSFYGMILPENFLTVWKGTNSNNILSDKDMDILNNIKEEDNPLIVIFNLKDEINR